MNEAKQQRRYQIAFVVVTALIILFSYTLVIGATNVFQQYVDNQHFNRSLYTQLSLRGFRLMTFLLLLNMLTRFQRLDYQRIFLLGITVILMFMPVSLKTFPFILGLAYTVTILGQTWLQMYVPEFLRGTISGIVCGLSSIIEIRSTAVENDWIYDLLRESQVTFLLLFCAVLFYFISIRLENKHIRYHDSQKNTESILNLFKKYPQIFLTCLILGFNYALMYDSFNLATAALPKMPPTTYQYMIFLGGVIGPIFIGPLADRYGPPLIIKSVLGLCIICNLIGSSLSFAHASAPIPYYILAFIGAAFVTSFWPLTYVLIGENLRTKGIFRSFAISFIFINIGTLLCDRIYQLVGNSFAMTTFLIAFVNIVFLALLWYLFKRFQTSTKK